MGIKEKLKAKFNRLPPDKKRKFVFFGTIALVITILSAVVIINDDPASRKKNKKDKEEQGVGNVLMATQSREIGIDGMSREVKALKDELAALKAESQRRDSSPGGSSATSPVDPDQALNHLVDQVGAERNNVAPTGTLMNRDRPASPGNGGTSSSGGSYQQPVPSPTQRPMIQGGGQQQAPIGGAPVITTQRSKEPQVSQIKQKLKSVYLPTGAMMTGILMTGLDAPTGRTAQSAPIPLLVRLKTEAILPSEYRSDVREAFVLAAGYGDLSSERAYIRAEKFSMILRNGEVIDIPIKMSAVGNDGKNGLRGRLVSKQGAVIAKALMAGMADGVSQAFGNNTTYSSSSDLPSGSELATSGISGGTSSALDRIAAYFLSQAEAMYPVIEIDGGREVTFILLEGTDLAPRSAEDKENRRIASANNQQSNNQSKQAQGQGQQSGGAQRQGTSGGPSAMK